VNIDSVGDGGVMETSEIFSKGMSRRTLLLGAAGLGAGGLLLPYGDVAGASSLTSGVTSLKGGKPIRGGTFTLGMITAGSEENLFPGTSASNPDWARVYNLYNFLFYCNSGKNLFPLVPGLALSAEPNADATSWVLNLRKGVVWHDGKPFTADDVVYNFTHVWNNGQSNYSAAYLTGLVDFRNIKKLNAHSVKVPLLKPAAQFPAILAYFNFGVIPNGATQKSIAANPVGTGPFKFKAFTPGNQSVFTANKNYWETGKPYVDTLVIDSSFTDDTALVNALMSNQVNLVASPQLVQAKQQLSSGTSQVLQSAGATADYMFGMRVDTGPFVDKRVREAFKLLVNRQQMIDGAFSGFGVVGNDLLGPRTQYFANDLKPKYDPEKAKSLFKAAGVEGKTFTWPTANALPGMVESTTILAEQASAAGIKINIRVGNPGTYWTPAQGAYVRPASVQVTQPCAALTVQYLGNIVLGCPYADTHWGAQKSGGAAANQLIHKAMGELNPTKASELWHEVQVEQVDQGGYLVWGNLPYIDLASKSVRGLKASDGFNFNNWRFCDGWLG
jgi:peptide/nickel transport system substrate-binding protein